MLVMKSIRNARRETDVLVDAGVDQITLTKGVTFMYFCFSCLCYFLLLETSSKSFLHLDLTQFVSNSGLTRIK